MTEETRLLCSANHVYREGYEQGRIDMAADVATRVELELLAVMPRDRVKYTVYKVKEALEKIERDKAN